MSMKQSKEFDVGFINKAKKYAINRNLDTLTATVEVFEKTKDIKYKLELYDIIKTMFHDIEDRDKRIMHWRTSQNRRHL